MGDTKDDSRRMRRPAAGERHAILLGRVGLALAVCAGAYHNSLTALIAGIEWRSPFGALGLSVLAALPVAALHARPPAGEPDIHDRYLDYMIGVPLVAIALAGLWLLPVALAGLYWHARLDLASLALFVAGATALCFGSRALWRLRVPVLLLALGCPAPFLLLGDALSRLTSASMAPAEVVMRLATGGQPGQIAAGPGLLAPHGGLDGVPAFLLLLSPVAMAARGRLSTRIDWLLAGAVAVWVLDGIRLCVMVWPSLTAGRWAALDVAGMPVDVAIFDAAVAATLAALALTGVRLRPPATGHRDDRFPQRRLRRPAVRNPVPAMAVVVLAGVLAAGVEQGMAQYRLIEQQPGQPRLSADAALSQPPAGLSLRPAVRPPWAAHGIGSGIAWSRFDAVPSGGAAPGGPPVTVDVFRTSSPASLTSPALDGFHPPEARLAYLRRLDLGGGVVGCSALYRVPVTGVAWLAVWWDWPVRTPSGGAYQRVVISVSAASDADLGREAAASPAAAAPVDGRGRVVDFLSGRSEGRASSAEAHALDFLSSLGSQVVRASERLAR